MIFSNGEQEYNVKAFYPVEYESELAHGVLIDFKENTYTFLSDHEPAHVDIMEEIGDAMGTETYDMTDCDIDWDEVPHSWVLRSLEKIIVDSCEEMLRDNIDDVG